MRASKPVYPIDVDDAFGILSAETARGFSRDTQVRFYHKSKMDTNLRGGATATAAAVAVEMDTDLILDICMLYTNEPWQISLEGYLFFNSVSFCANYDRELYIVS